MNFYLICLCIIFGAIAVLLLRTPAPKGITQPWKYRLLAATLTLYRTVARIIAHLQGGNVNAYVRTLRFLHGVTNSRARSKVQGSSIKSKVEVFDGVRVRIYEQIIKRTDSLRPALIYIHGGGHVMGSTDGCDHITRDIAQRLGDMVVISIDYRLAPEHPFPAGLNDCLRGTTWLMRYADIYGIDSTRVAIAGDDAGGNLAAAIAQVINDDESVPNFKLQIILYPGLQTLDFLTPSYQKYEHEFGDGGVLPRKAVASALNLYLSGKGDTHLSRQILSNQHLTDLFCNNSYCMNYINHDVIPDELRHQTRDYVSPKERSSDGDKSLWQSLEGTFLDPRWAPLLRKELSGLPQTLIITCGFDCLRDDGIFYAKRLETAGVETKWKHFNTAFSGVLFLSNLFRFDVGEEMIGDVVDFIKENVS